jgi:hypothetical protein
MKKITSLVQFGLDFVQNGSLETIFNSLKQKGFADNMPTKLQFPPL